MVFWLNVFLVKRKINIQTLTHRDFSANLGSSCCWAPAFSMFLSVCVLTVCHVLFTHSIWAFECASLLLIFCPKDIIRLNSGFSAEEYKTGKEEKDCWSSSLLEEIQISCGLCGVLFSCNIKQKPALLHHRTALASSCTLLTVCLVWESLLMTQPYRPYRCEVTHLARWCSERNLNTWAEGWLLSSFHVKHQHSCECGELISSPLPWEEANIVILWLLHLCEHPCVHHKCVL